MQCREEHLEYAIACLGTLTSRGSQMNARLREDYESHQPEPAQVEVHTKVIEGARDKAYTVAQAMESLSYKAGQFHVQNLWHAASPQRQVETYSILRLQRMNRTGHPSHVTNNDNK